MKGVILIVDDSADDAHLLRRALQSFLTAPKITIVSHGKAAIDYLQGSLASHQSQPLPRVIFLDLKLPDISGYAVLKWMGDKPELRRTLVVIHSGASTTREIEQLYAAGANTFLSKAADRVELANLIHSYKAYFD